MHHSPSGPPFSARTSGTLTRLGRLLRQVFRLRGRIAPVVLVCGVVAGIALALPALGPVATTSFADSAQDRLDSSAASSSGGSSSGGSSSAGSSGDSPEDDGEQTGVVQLGVDGVPAPQAAPSPPAATPEAASPAAEDPVAEPAGDAPAADPAEAEEQAPAADPAPSAPAAGPAAAAAPAAPGIEGQVVALVNQERAAAGCGSVVADEGLASVARAFSADMRDRNFFSHTDPDGLSPFDRGDRSGVTVMAENIAYGQPDAASVMTDWMNSPGHRANILNCSYSRLGVGVAEGPGGPWWTQDFA